MFGNSYTIKKAIKSKGYILAVLSYIGKQCIAFGLHHKITMDDLWGAKTFIDIKPMK